MTLDDDVFTAARTLARGAGKSLGQVLSELARRGLHAEAQGTGPANRGSGPPRFTVPPDAPGISLNKVRAAWEEL